MGLALATAPAAAQTTDEIVSRGRILIAIDTNNPPWGMLDASMQPDGIDVSVARLLAKYMGVQLEIVPVTSQNRIPFILTGMADLVMATLTVTPQRVLQIWFSNPYAAQASIIMAPATSPITNFDDLKGKKVSEVRGAIQDAMVVMAARSQRSSHIGVTPGEVVGGGRAGGCGAVIWAAAEVARPIKAAATARVAAGRRDMPGLG